MEEKVNLLQQRQWEAKGDEGISIPEAYITPLKYEILVFRDKKTFTFRCKEYEHGEGGQWNFTHVIIDSSERDPSGEVVTKRITYHPWVELINTPCMVIPAPEDAE